MGCLAQLFCQHEWKHQFVVERYGSKIICYCWKCQKHKSPSHVYPWPGDEILDVREKAE